MSKFTSTEYYNFDDEEVFEDSFLARFDNSSFGETAPRLNEANISVLNVSALCCDEEISGYDKLAGQNWIYPTNYPVRDYQFNIINAALIKNTLVSLPTGLGKTFIAAVIMYNFYRWYPLGKIVFTAPTRPLVAQQIDACYNIIAIPPDDTIEMTGHMQVTTRKAHWQSKRVFFATPQVIYNDIKSGICPADKIRCLVIDEAHRARGNYAYCQIVSTLNDMECKTYRLLALSATPGSKVEDVINVVKNLHIAHLELRTESCIDVAPYSHARKINTVVIELGPKLSQLRSQYVDILDGYARRLKELNILPQNLGNLSKGRIVMLYKEFQTKERSARHPQHNFIMKDFTLLIALFHGLELLVKHGSRVFLNFFDDHPEKAWIQSDDRLTLLLERLRDDLGTNPMSLDRSILPDGTIPEMPQDLCFGHPKFYKLKEIMLNHFANAQKNGQDTRAIVFCEYRESVNLVHCLLLQCRPLITAQMFVGQGASGKDGKAVVSQKQQLRVMRSFREGGCNTLVATCVAEEGLDVGSVDLILCFDISTRSPIRLVQRCGRTGRERGGQVFILVTEGREHQTLMDCIRQKDGLNKKIQNSRDVQNSLYKSNPRMIPYDFTPKCLKMYITVEKKPDAKDKNTAKKSKKPLKDLRTMLLGRASSSGSSSSNLDGSLTEIISEMEFKEIYPNGFKCGHFFEQSKEYWNMNKGDLKQYSERTEKPKLSTWLEWQRKPQKTINIGHSQDTDILTRLLDYSDAKRFEMPVSTQNPTFNTQDLVTPNVNITSPIKTKTKPRKTKVVQKSPMKKDGDIRALFSSVTKSTTNYTKLINDLGIQNDGSIPTKLINLLVDLSIDNSNYKRDCYICSNICNCTLLKNEKQNVQYKKHFPFLIDLKLPSLELIDKMNAETIKQHTKINDLNPNKCKIEDEKTNNFNLQIDFEAADFFSDDIKDIDKVVDKSEDNNFDLGEIDDIFADSSPEEATAIVKQEEVIEKEEKPKEVLNFFNLDSIEDIFADDDDIFEVKPNTPEKKAETNLKIETPEIDKLQDIEFVHSPSILSGRKRINDSITTSPILGSQNRKFQLSTKKSRSHSTPVNSVARKKLQLPSENNNHLTSTPSAKNNRSITDTSKSMLSVTQIINMINKTDNKSINTSLQMQTFHKPKEGVDDDENRSTSPIILTQADLKNVSRNSNTSLKLQSFHKSKDGVNDDENRSTSPIILTQAQLKNLSSTSNHVRNTPSQKNANYESLIILDSDSDSDNTQEYKISEFKNIINDVTTHDHDIPTTSKRNINGESPINQVQSPYFNKRRKTDDKKTLTLQEKVLAALSNSQKKTNSNSDTAINFVLTTSTYKQSPQKENISPNKHNYLHQIKQSENECTKRNNLSMLQMFRRDSKVRSPKSKFSSILDTQVQTPQKRKLTFEDSDDDFIVDDKVRNDVQKSTQSVQELNTKVRKKKKRKPNSFLELEAEISDDGDCESGDELSDDSVGSIIDFICDENETIHEDMQAHYLRSIKSPVKGVFKIPDMPKKFKNSDIFSQKVEEDDAYEMDSFCVDADIGLTQANELSELEMAEIVLENRKKSKKKNKIMKTADNGDGSPVVVRRKLVKRLIDSDSDDSS